MDHLGDLRLATVSQPSDALRWSHFASLLYGIVIEIAPWDCPLTSLEQWLEANAGIVPYREPFLVHYLEALVYPNVPLVVLVPVSVGICVVNLFLHANGMKRRWRSARA